MLKTRVIPVMLWDDRGLVKPVGFQRPGRLVGSLMSASMVYENRACDEIILLDIDATSNNRPPRFDAIKQFTSRIFCPLAVGGGIRTLDDISGLLNAGADKVVVRTLARPGFIQEASRKFGAQCISVAMDYDDPDIDLLVIRAKTMELLGAGEIILTNKMRDGTFAGYDLPTLRAVARAVTIPIIANGGCSGPGDMLAALRAGAHAVAASSLFLFRNVTPDACKAFLAENDVPVRIEV